jgi:hypothetical protein
LGDSEVAAVKHTPSQAIPEVGQRAKDEPEVFSAVGREETWNVLDEKNSGATLLNESSELMKESRSLPLKPSSRPHSRQ